MLGQEEYKKNFIRDRAHVKQLKSCSVLYANIDTLGSNLGVICVNILTLLVHKTYYVALVRNDVSEERIVTIIRVTRIGDLETTLGVTSNGSTLLHNISLQSS
jgi:hypothetical protein